MNQSHTNQVECTAPAPPAREGCADASSHVSTEWEALFDALPDPVAVIDCDHRFVRVNRVLADRLRMERTALIGRPCYEVVHGTTTPPAFCPHSRALEDGRSHCARVYEPTLDAFFDVSATPLPDAKGRIVGTVHVLHELIDERHG